MADTRRPPAPDTQGLAEVQAWLIEEHERLHQVYGLIWPGRELCHDAELLRPVPDEEPAVIAGLH